MNSKYRVNFGNGQVHYAGGRKECERFIAESCDGYTFLQVREDGEWFQVRRKKSA